MRQPSASGIPAPRRMEIVIAAVGRPRAGPLADAIRQYETRAARYWPLAAREVRAEPARGTSVHQVREREGERLLAALGSATVVACDAEGDALTSDAFARWLQAERERAGPDLAFCIGGAFGLSDTMLRRATRRIAFSRWTMSHELARLVLAEQLYRAGTIVRGEPYHK
ncbi:MAG TPA: 23S rRNA (pseudouridine(1915)-N(3))-methyltransferase RlmH [Gemmatimonadaceae bacterium]|nr:23S rRNA (pseudouridine(1915)-N(3))-methyltransferase RlmH [Gemmatimonadaceae bacterium]